MDKPWAGTQGIEKTVEETGDNLMGKRKSECMKRYGREWSKNLTETTREYFSSMFMGPVKHIAGKGERYAVERIFLSMKAYAALVPEEEKGKEVFLFTFTEYNPFKGGAKGLAFDVAYDSVDDMIDDGWAVD